MSEGPTETDQAAYSMRVDRRTVTLREQVIETLRRAIMEGRFGPGERLVERELCDLTGVSRTSLREALRFLEAEGLVQTVPNKGPIVARITETEARDIYEIREALEPLAARRFAALADEPLMERLHQVMTTLETALSGGDARAIQAATTAYYDVLLDGCGNAVVRDIITSLQARVVYLRLRSMSRPGRAGSSLKEMRELTDAIRRRDFEAVETLSRQHVRNASDAAFRAIEDSRDPAP